MKPNTYSHGFNALNYDKSFGKRPPLHDATAFR